MLLWGMTLTRLMLADAALPDSIPMHSTGR